VAATLGFAAAVHAGSIREAPRLAVSGRQDRVPDQRSAEDLVRAGIVRVPRVVGTHAGRPQLEGGQVLDVKAILWCTGFAMDFSWIRLPIFTADGYPIHERGRVASAPGLYFVGLPLQRSLSSSTLLGVARDAAVVSDWIIAS
jgi:putative flavoprotein involved in K+ transport